MHSCASLFLHTAPLKCNGYMSLDVMFFFKLLLFLVRGGIHVYRGLSQYFETGCPKLAIVKLYSVLFFKGKHSILRLETKTCIYLSK